MAFTGLELLYPHRSVGVDGKDQVVELDAVSALVPVLLVTGVADLGVFLVTLENERTHRPAGCLIWLALPDLSNWPAYSAEWIEAKLMAKFCSMAASGFFQHEPDGIRINLFHLGNVAVHAHVGEIRELGTIGLVERMVLVEHALEREHHVVGVEFTRRLEVVGGVESDTAAQVESVGLAVRADFPLFGQSGATTRVEPRSNWTSRLKTVSAAASKSVPVTYWAGSKPAGLPSEQ